MRSAASCERRRYSAFKEQSLPCCLMLSARLLELLRMYDFPSVVQRRPYHDKRSIMLDAVAGHHPAELLSNLADNLSMTN